MRFISLYSGFKIPGVHEQTERLADGTARVVAPGFMCEFQHGGLTNADIAFARRTFVWKGLPTAQDGTSLDPITDLHRVSVFDTEVVPESLRAKVEASLLANAGQDYALVETEALQPPWPAYDKLVVQGRRTIDLVVEKIVATVSENGYDPAEVAAYERENLNRPEVLAALETVSEPDVELVSA